MTETKLKIRVFGDSILRRKANPLKRVTDEHRQILSQMAKAMYDDTGIGLAAPQIGHSLQLIVVDIGEGLYKLVNPKIIKRQGKQSISEGCLSVPSIRALVPRYTAIKIDYLNEQGDEQTAELECFVARVFQHEFDHLQGKVFLDSVETNQDIFAESEYLKLL